MDEEQFEELHSAIEKGDADLVRHLLPENAEGQYFFFDDHSALFKAFYCRNYEIASLLIHKGAKVHANEDYDLDDLEIDLDHLNYLLLDYNKKSEKSCIYQLISWSQSPQELDGVRLCAVISMYEEFYKSEILKMIMLVLEKEAFDIVYDFNCEEVNRTHRLDASELEVYGLTLTNPREIFIGAKNLLSGNLEKRSKVYGVVAEELCHLAMTILFENHADPFRKEDIELEREFQDIIWAVKCSIDQSCHIKSVIEDVYNYYNKREWGCELIARVPHVIGIYGEESGRIVMESRELSRLFTFYRDKVYPKCKEYTDPSLNTKPRRLMENLRKKNDFISFKEKRTPPLKEGFPSFGQHLECGISAISTNCKKLCTLHVYHELKRELEVEVEKKCLFFAGKCFRQKSEEILNVLKLNIWEYFILVLDEDLTAQKFKDEHLDDFLKLESEDLRIVIINSSRSFGKEIRTKTVNYRWNDLTDDYKALLQYVKYIFKGEEETIYVPKESFLNVFDEEDIRRIIDGDLFEVDDGEELYSQGYIPETYVEREIQTTVVSKEILDGLPDDTSIFISGLCESYFENLSIDENSVQWVKAQNENLQGGKSIFIDKGGMTFKDFSGKNLKTTKIWLHHLKGEFYLCDSDYSSGLNKYTKPIKYSEAKVVNYLISNRIIIISDNPGSGKSTVISGIIKYMKENISFSHMVWRVNLSEFCRNEKDLSSLAHIKESSSSEEVLDQLFEMLGLNNGLEKLLFEKYSRDKFSFIFFDGFDEVGSKFRNSALKLLTVLNEKTTANVVITTRKHQQRILEETLKTHSHQLVPFSREPQVRYLEKLWKWKLKFPRGTRATASKKDKQLVLSKVEKIIRGLENERAKLDIEYQDLTLGLGKLELENDMDSIRIEVDNLDFSKLAKHILYKTSLDETMLHCMEIPLHLYMIGVIHYDGNFNVELQSDIFGLYSQFVEQKILIYLEEKQGLQQEGALKDKNIEAVTNDTYSIHIQLADQLLDKGKVCLSSEIDEDKLELCSAVGIVFVQAAVQFIHQTFAEFFKAESLRQKIHPVGLKDVLFEDRYNIVRRFLSSGLANKDFEQLEEGFIKDVDFFVAIVERIVNMPPAYGTYNADYDTFCLLKIVNKLLKSFEELVEGDLVDRFTEQIHGSIMSQTKKGKKRLHKYMYHVNVGGCLTVKMLKNMMFKNFKVYFFICFNFVRFSESPAEVIEIVEKCIYINPDGGSDGKQKKGKGNKQKAAEAKRLLKLLSINISNRRGLLYHAVCNDKAEIFARLLKLFRDLLKRGQFMKIVEDVEFREVMRGFIEEVNINRICKLFRELHSVFKSETKFLFDTNDKVCLIDRAIKDDADGFEDLFQKVTCLFCECFGKEELKNLIQNNDLMYKLFKWCSSEALLKNLNVVRDILDGKGEMKEFMKNTCDDLQNVFHLAVEQNRHLRDLLLYIRAELKKDEIEDILLSSDCRGRNVMHYLFEHNSPEALMENLKVVKDILRDEGRLKHLLKSKDKFSRNMFHLAVLRGIINENLLRFYDSHLEKEEIKEMLISEEEFGDRAVISLFQNSSFDAFAKIVNVTGEIMGGDGQLNQILSIKDRSLRNIFHLAVLRGMVFGELLQFCNAHCGKVEIVQNLLSTDKDGHNVVHYFFDRKASETFMKSLHVVENVLADDGMLKQLLMSRDGLSRNLFHLALLKDVYLGELWEFCDAHLEKDEVKEMLLSTDKDGSNMMHYSFKSNSTETLVKNLNLTKQILGDDVRFTQLLRSENKSSQTIFHFAAQSFREMNLSFLDSYLNRNEIENLLIRGDKDGQTCLHIAGDYNTLHQLLSYADEMLTDRRSFEDLIMKEDERRCTLLHCLVKGFSGEKRIQLVKKVFFALQEKLPTELYESLLRVRNKHSETFLGISESHNRAIYHFCKNKFRYDLFEELLQVKFP